MDATPHDDNTRQPSNNVFARWREHATLLSPIPSQTPTLIHCYEAVVLPPTPIRLGTRLRLIALSPRMYSWQSEIPDHLEYVTYDPYVVRAVVGVRSFRGSDDEMEVIVQNEVVGNKVAYAHITLGGERRSDHRADQPINDHDHWIFSQMPAEPWPASPSDGTKIYDATSSLPASRLTLCFPDPKSDYATMIECTWGIRLKRRRDRRKRANDQLVPLV